MRKHEVDRFRGQTSSLRTFWSPCLATVYIELGLMHYCSRTLFQLHLGLKHFNPNVFSCHYVVTVVQLIWKVGRLLSTPQKLLTPLPSCLSKYSPWRQMLLGRIHLQQLGFVKGKAVCTVWHGYWPRFLFEKMWICNTILTASPLTAPEKNK